MILQIYHSFFLLDLWRTGRPVSFAFFPFQIFISIIAAIFWTKEKKKFNDDKFQNVITNIWLAKKIIPFRDYDLFAFPNEITKIHTNKFSVKIK